jgi:uncharacterized RDD family membrane protein YckC
MEAAMAEHLFQTRVSAPTITSERAGFWRRFVAAFLDGILLNLVSLPISAAAGMSMGASAGAMVIIAVISVAYFAAFEGTSGQTIGKRAMGIRVVDADTGDPIGVSRAIGRWFGRIVSTVVVYLGYLWMLWDGNKQTWHDKMVSTVVVPD